ncbi:glucosamine--fructose-6-phosphate aminotransferase [Paenibacillus sp. J31TS4]|uniref:SIS domain-containing protein n=1 Tax=Paenibacillus sp. J31TS4 TaxID=2807195 RepID=UPI001B26882F|nr:SIS domain-containing protein [Paenibacillus sp. J31TS4]GIP37266.1 glucosamine--fructose-6-phosphate aminotransferase [Paenibacillus sp. J31TS4]
MEFGKLTYPEISSQAEALQAALAGAEQSKDWIDRYIGNSSFDEVVFIGSGSSYYQAQTMASTYRKWVGRDASAWPSSEIFLFRDQAAAAGRSYLLVGVSRSGESTEVILALDSVKELPNWTTCGITCYADSKMGQMTDCLVSELGKEKSTVMTKSFSSMTYMMQAAIALAAGKQQELEALREVAQLDAEVVKNADSAASKLAQTAFNKYIYLGMGAYYGLAQEACLKIKEMSYVWTESFGTLEFRHGPKSVVDPGTLVCVLVSEQARSYELKVAEEMKAYGAHVVLITARQGDDTAFADTVFEIGGASLSDEARSALYLPFLQYLGYYTALGRNVDPDHPRNLTQVVIL